MRCPPLVLLGRTVQCPLTPRRAHAHATFFFFPFSFRSDSQIEMSSFMPNISGRGICRGTVPPAYQVPPSGWESSRRGRRGGGLKPSKKGKMEKEEIANQFLFSESSLSFFLPSLLSLSIRRSVHNSWLCSLQTTG